MRKLDHFILPDHCVKCWHRGDDHPQGTWDGPRYEGGRLLFKCSCCGHDYVHPVFDKKEQVDDLKTLQLKLKIMTKEMEAWQREHNMYRSAWLRELGGSIVAKHHEIDGFVLTTREHRQAYLREKARKQE